MKSYLLAVLALAFCAFDLARAGGNRHVVQPDGTGQILNAQGQVLASGKIVSGRVDGAWNFFESNGTTVATLQFSRGHLNGPMQLNFGSREHPLAAGKVETSGEFNNDSPVGAWSCHDESGRVFNKRVYDRGELISAEGIDAQGRPISADAAMAQAKELEKADQQLVNSLLALLR